MKLKYNKIEKVMKLFFGGADPEFERESSDTLRWTWGELDREIWKDTELLFLTSLCRPDYMGGGKEDQNECDQWLREMELYIRRTYEENEVWVAMMAIHNILNDRDETITFRGVKSCSNLKKS